MNHLQVSQVFMCIIINCMIIGLISISQVEWWDEGYSPLTASCSRYAHENTLSNCSLSTYSNYNNYYYYSHSCTRTCSHPKAIRCYSKCVCVIVLTSCCLTGGNSCTDGDVRLVDGSLDQEGRVEVCVNGVWGSVCGHGWSSSDGRVVCKQLGYPDSSMIINHTVILMILLILTSSQRVNQWEIWRREWAHFLLRCELSGLGKQFIPVWQNLLPSILMQL